MKYLKALNYVKNFLKVQKVLLKRQLREMKQVLLLGLKTKWKC